MESAGERQSIAWSAPQCPFRIEISARALDEIRMAVVDAFFSLPRGGAEIGGVLLGKFAGNLLTISDYAALSCEHAHGPGFTLSPPDEARLTELLAVHSMFGGGLRPVGWYHSHTRSEIFLSDADLAVHKKFFPEPWQVALVLKPHTFQPMRMGFFFREADGGIHASASYREEELAPLPMEGELGPRAVEDRPAEVGTAATEESESVELQASLPFQAPMEYPAAIHEEPDQSEHAGHGRGFDWRGADSMAEAARESAPPASDGWRPERVVPEERVAPPPVVAAEEPAIPRRAVREEAYTPAEVAPPKFLMSEPEPERKPRSWGWVIGLVAILGIAGAAVATRQYWVPRVAALSRTEPTAPPAPVAAPALGLNTLDHEGQLQINWDRTSPAVLQGTDAMLQISEAGAPLKAIELDSAHLQAGTFTYAREVEKVDVKLIVHGPKGVDIRETTGFFGKLPERKAPEPANPAPKQADESDKQTTARLKSDIAFLAAKTKKIEKDLDLVRQELRLQQLRRLNNQVPSK
jgi:proteasome lid subunit RPN8/RPN11